MDRIPRELANRYDSASEDFSKARGTLYSVKQEIFEYCVANKLYHILKLSDLWRRYIG